MADDSVQTTAADHDRPRSWGLRVFVGAGLLAAAVLAFTLATLPQYGITSDEPVIYFGGEWQLWALGQDDPKAWRFKEPPPPEFLARTRFTTHPDGVGHWAFPGFPGLVCAATERIARHLPGYQTIDGFHAGIALLHALAVFAFVLYLARLIGLRRALLAGALYALYPSAVGHSHYNVKDWPMTGFYALTLVSFAVGVVENRARFLLQSGVWLGLGLASKANPVFAMPTLVLWLPFAAWLFYRGGRLPTRRAVAAACVMPAIALATLWMAWPYLRAGSALAQWDKFHDMVRLILERGKTPRDTWSSYSLVLVLTLSPPVYLLGLLASPVAALAKDRRAAAMLALGWIWLAIPVLRIAVPHSNYYDANRHFIEYVPALALLAAMGLDAAIERLARWIELRKPTWSEWSRRGGIAAVVGLAAWPVVEYHPYETTYYNAFVGGLGGAQKRKLTEKHCEKMEWWCPDSEGDYWGFSYRRALAEVGKLAAPGATFHACGNLVQPLTRFTPRRPDLREADVNGADWFVVIPRRPFCGEPEQAAIRERGVLVREERRGGGLVWALYRKR